MKCGRCGSDNPDYTIYCGKCGSDLGEAARLASSSSSQEIPQRRPSEPLKPRAEKSETLTRFCSKCGKEINAKSITCPVCGEEPWNVKSDRWNRIYDSEYTYTEEHTKPKEKTGLPLLGGIFAILAGVFAVGQGLIYMAGATVIDLPGTGALCLCGGVDFLFGAASVFGGICAIKRDHFVMSILGAVLGMLGLGFLIGAVFGLLAVIFIALSKDEFE